MAFFADNNGRTGILAGGQHALGRDIGVSQELQRDIFVVFTGLRIAQNIRHLLLMRGT
ncbi:Uncharacterised protein [Salmonella enterica subsp. enterica serovar Bovismorbificans]|uniref:Uncharacterized protein n=1 Tax=Salmonella enterica subsp. enterica serovar Bovismorbificans TaxID=58097 RepID=A0A655EF91_SALET|nr:Uncharacterised protein [Salmonella enterica subsp. enterica serovar Bovismorbificans]